MRTISEPENVANFYLCVLKSGGPIKPENLGDIKDWKWVNPFAAVNMVTNRNVKSTQKAAKLLSTGFGKNSEFIDWVMAG